MKTPRLLALGTFTLAFAVAASSTASADVRLTIQDGRVSLVAKDATLRQILAEWARVGQTKIVNAERVPGGPVTLQLTNVPEEQALATLLRSLTGYVAAPRPTDAGNLSQFDRIVVVPTIAAAPAAQCRDAQWHPADGAVPGRANGADGRDDAGHDSAAAGAAAAAEATGAWRAALIAVRFRHPLCPSSTTSARRSPMRCASRNR